MRQLTLSQSHRTIIIALIMIAGLLAVSIQAIKHTPTAAGPDSKLGEHYARLLSPAVTTSDKESINAMLASMVEDEQIILAAVYTTQGERIAQQGVNSTMPELLKAEPQRESHLAPINNQTTIIGYLHWVSEPKS